MLPPSARLRNAIIQGNLPITARLLSRFPSLWLNVDPNADGWSNLHYASYHGHYLICFHLVSFLNQMGTFEDQYSHLDLVAFDNTSVLHVSASHHHAQTLHYLLQEFPGRIWRDSPGGKHSRTPLHTCCAEGFTEGVKLLLEFGADWLKVDKNGHNCLHIAFEYGHFSCVEVIVGYIAGGCDSADEFETKIAALDAMHSNDGYVPADYAVSFLMAKMYRDLKRTAWKGRKQSIHDKHDTIQSSDNNAANVEVSRNVLASPIVSVTPEVQGRKHSQSLPTEVRPSATRKRSNTSYNKPPPLGASPRVRTPSLKSVTISPSSKRDDEDRSHRAVFRRVTPDGVITPSESVASSPQKELTGMNYTNGNVKESEKKPQREKAGREVEKTDEIETPPDRPDDRHGNRADRKDRTEKERFVSSKLPSLPETSKSGEEWPHMSPASTRVPSSTSSPVKKSVRVPDDAVRSRRSSSASSIVRNVVFSSSRTSLANLESPSRRRPSLSNWSPGGSEELSPTLRKTQSSTTLQSPGRSPFGFSNDSTDSLKRYNVNSVSFNRLR